MIQVGDTMGEIIGQCGQPYHRTLVSRDTHWRNDSNSGTAREITTERWVYRFETFFGSEQFSKILSFRGGRLTNVEIGDKF